MVRMCPCARDCAILAINSAARIITWRCACFVLTRRLDVAVRVRAGLLVGLVGGRAAGMFLGSPAALLMDAVVSLRVCSVAAVQMTRRVAASGAACTLKIILVTISRLTNLSIRSRCGITPGMRVMQATVIHSFTVKRTMRSLALATRRGGRQGIGRLAPWRAAGKAQVVVIIIIIIIVVVYVSRIINTVTGASGRVLLPTSAATAAACTHISLMYKILCTSPRMEPSVLESALLSIGAHIL
jgi:hypothetical protein